MPRSRELLDRYGHGRAIVLARFIPVIRTVLNPVARALAVPVRGFTLWQTIGGLLWTVAGREAVRVGELWRFAI